MKNIPGCAMFMGFFLALTIVACGYVAYQKHKIVKTWTETKFVKRIFMHEPDSYSVMAIDENGALRIEQVARYSMLPASSFSFKLDVEHGEDPWLEITKALSAYGTVRTIRVVFHLQSASQLEGGGWNHGKFGSGATVPIQ